MSGMPKHHASQPGGFGLPPALERRLAAIDTELRDVRKSLEPLPPHLGAIESELLEVHAILHRIEQRLLRVGPTRPPGRASHPRTRPRRRPHRTY